MKTRMLAFLFSLIIATGISAAELTVHAAASLADAMNEIGPAYEKQSGDGLQLNFGASSMLARQIEEGAPADLFFSADEAKMDALEKKDLLFQARGAACFPICSSSSFVRTHPENGRRARTKVLIWS
jgi:molybdate transport system substrate-binding protein